MTTHDMMRTETTQMSLKKLDNPRWLQELNALTL